MSWKKLVKWSLQGLLMLAVFQFFGTGNRFSSPVIEEVRAYTRAGEFDYLTWTLDALGVKFNQAAVSAWDYLPLETQKEIVLEYLEIVADIQTAEAHLADIYANPNVLRADTASALVRGQLERLYTRRAELAPLAESILQQMVSEVLVEMGFDTGGQVIPPVLYHSTPLPWALVISPRSEIRQTANIQLQVDMTLDERIALEGAAAAGLDVSALVVPIGGIGVYPTMVLETSSLTRLAEVVGHEWMHNYLTLRPLGMLYMETPALRTMNETAASIAGNEISLAILERFFPELLPPPPENTTPPPPEEPSPDTPPPFDFRAEMRITRIHVDDLLAQGLIEEAEAYMEERRAFLWENGYHIRKLNQAYFAFYGAYADEPGGAAGEDPVGAAVRSLRANSDSLYDFIQAMAWLTSFEQLEGVLGEP